MSFRLTVKVFGGDQQILTSPSILIAVTQGNAVITGPVAVRGGVAVFQLDSGGSHAQKMVTVHATAKGFLKNGIIGKLIEEDEGEVSLLLLSREAKFRLQGSMPWVDARWPKGLSVSAERFAGLASADPLRAAFLLNLAEALLNIPGGSNLLEALLELPLRSADERSRENRRSGVLQDRLLADARSGIVALLEEMERKDQFEKAPSGAHGKPKPNEKVHSWKESLYDEAGLQFTVFDNPVPRLAYVDIDFDYFRDGISHFIQEYLPNQIFKWKTHPLQVYARRWMQARNFAGDEERVFSPAYRWIA